VLIRTGCVLTGRPCVAKDMPVTEGGKPGGLARRVGQLCAAQRDESEAIPLLTHPEEASALGGAVQGWCSAVSVP
jgi:hypothetical protein